jgi:hypothetical protein
MLRFIGLALVSLSLAACASLGPGPKAQGLSSEAFLDYQPIAPLPALRVPYYDAHRHRYEDRFWASFPDTAAGNAEKRRLLPIQSAYTYIIKDDASGKLSYLSNSASLARGDYTVISDYILYRVERVAGAGVGLVGIGMRVRAKLRTTQAGLNLGGLFSLALAAQAKHLSGELEVDVIGLSSKDIIQIFPAMSADISPASIAEVMQAMAAIKAKIADPDVQITPYLLAFKQSAPGREADIVRSLAYVQGVQAGARQRAWIQAIGAYIGTDGDKWRRLVEASALSAQQKRTWKGYAVGEVVSRLRRETARGHSDVLPKLYEAYQGLSGGGGT